MLIRLVYLSVVRVFGWLARTLTGLGVGSESVVAVAMERFCAADGRSAGRPQGGGCIPADRPRPSRRADRGHAGPPPPRRDPHRWAPCRRAARARPPAGCGGGAAES